MTTSQTFEQRFTEVYGLSYRQSTTIRELALMAKYSQVLDEIHAQRAFTISYLSFLFEGEVSETTIRRLCSILVNRDILQIQLWEGKAVSTWGVHVYLTPDASSADVDNILREYRMQDELRHRKQQQREELRQKRKQKKKVTPEEQKRIWLQQAEAAREVREQLQTAELESSQKEWDSVLKLALRTKGKLKCPQCLRTFPTESLYVAHVRDLHRQTGDSGRAA